jgi:DNA-binding response OmpR family regulator
MDVRFRHILVVDDNETMRSLVSGMLAKMDLEVSSVENAEKGMDLFLNNNFDLVITDFDMPVMNGIDLASRIKKKSPQTLIVLMTGRQKEEIQATVEGAIVDRTLFKPFSFVELKDTIQKISNLKELNFLSNLGSNNSKAKSSDRRKESRLCCSESIYFTTKKRIHMGKLINQSRSGLFIEAANCFAEDERILAVVPCVNNGDAICKGRIIWCNGQGFGVELSESLA